MAFSDLATKRLAQSVIFLLLTTFSTNALASDSQLSNFKCFRSRSCPPVAQTQDHAQKKLAALSPDPPAEVLDSAVTADPPVPSPSKPPSPAPAPSHRPAVISPHAHMPGSDLPPLRTPPSSNGNSTSVPASVSPDSSMQSKLAVSLGVTLGVLVFCWSYCQPQLM